jgi:hypothetical protein
MQWMQDLAGTMFWVLALMAACWLLLVASVFGAMREWHSHEGNATVQPMSDDERRAAGSRRAA